MNLDELTALCEKATKSGILECSHDCGDDAGDFKIVLDPLYDAARTYMPLLLAVARAAEKVLADNQEDMTRSWKKLGAMVVPSIHDIQLAEAITALRSAE